MVSRRLLAKYIASRLSAGEPKKEVLQQLAAYVVEHRLHKQLEMIVSDIQAELAALGTVVADVTSARPLSKALLRQLEEYVATQTGAQRVTIKETVDPDIIGGVIIRTPGRTLDASIASSLKQLKTT